MQGNNSYNNGNNAPESLRFRAGAEPIIPTVVGVDRTSRVNRGLIDAS